MPQAPGLPLRPREEPFREFSVIFHDEIFAVQAFPGFFNDPVFRHTLAGVKDGFAINYGTGGIGSEILANRLGVGPQFACNDCKYEEFFLTSWALGDPALVVDVEGFEGPLDLLLTLARNQKVDLAKISVLALAEQYLAFIEAARQLRLELAADYLVMAAWLAYLKSRLLLPEAPGPDGPSAGEARIMAMYWKEITVNWGESDPFGLVYYPRIVAWFNDTEHELFRIIGYPIEQMIKNDRTTFVMGEIHFRFIGPAAYGDRIVTTITLADIGDHTLHWNCKAKNAVTGAAVSEGRATRVYARINEDGSLKAQVIPADMVNAIRELGDLKHLAPNAADVRRRVTEP